MILDIQKINKDDDKEKAAQLIIEEIKDCRSDERDCQTQILQVMGVAATLISVLLGGSCFINRSDSDAMNEEIIKNFGNLSGIKYYIMKNFIAKYFTPNRIIFICINIVLIVALTYILQLAIMNVVRYHHVKELYANLRKIYTSLNLEEMNNIYLWDEVRAPVVTMNPFHISSYLALSHFAAYLTSIIFCIIFCIIVTVIQFFSIHPRYWYDKIGLFIVYFVVFFCISCLLYSAFHGTKNMKAIQNDITRRRERKEGTHSKEELSQEQKDRLHNIAYFIYPRFTDLQKPCLIILGAILYCMLCKYSFSWNYVFNVIVSIVVFDFCGYQIRFQINDLRGIDEDQESVNNNDEKGQSKRLRWKEFNLTSYIKLSLFVILFRVIFAFFMIIAISPAALRKHLLWELLILLFICILYEIARTKHYNWMVFLLVGTGYPLRIIVGVLAICATSQVIISKSIICFLLAMYFWGMFASLISWASDVVKIREKKEDGLTFKKDHFRVIYQWIENSYSSAVDKKNTLRAKGRIQEIWHLGFCLSIFFLSCMPLFSYGDIGLFVFEIPALILLIRVCYIVSQDKIQTYIVGSIIIIIVKGLIAVFITSDILCGAIALIQIFVIATYYIFRYNPKSVDLAKYCAGFMYVLSCMILSENIVKRLIQSTTEDTKNNKTE